MFLLLSFVKDTIWLCWTSSAKYLTKDGICLGLFRGLHTPEDFEPLIISASSTNMSRYDSSPVGKSLTLARNSSGLRNKPCRTPTCNSNLIWVSTSEMHPLVSFFWLIFSLLKEFPLLCLPVPLIFWLMSCGVEFPELFWQFRNTQFSQPSLLSRTVSTLV